jgi:hypothetical protein
MHYKEEICVHTHSTLIHASIHVQTMYSYIFHMFKLKNIKYQRDWIIGLIRRLYTLKVLNPYTIHINIQNTSIQTCELVASQNLH